MNKKNTSIIYNFLMNIVLTASSFLFQLITFPYVSRILLPEGTGKVSFATSVVSYFLIIAQLGIPTYGIRACAKVRDNREELCKTVKEILGISIIMCIIAYALFGVSVAFIPKLHEEKKLLIVVSSMIVFTTLGVEWLYKALEMYSYITWRSIAFKFIALIAMFLFVKKREDYVIYGAISILASCASGICNFIYLGKVVDLGQKYSLNFRKHIKPILIFFAMSCATTVYLNLDTVMLGFMKTDEDVGYYNAAVKIKNMLVSIITSLGTVLLPRVTYYIENGKNDDFKALARKAIRFVIFLSIPLLIYFILFAEQGILLLSGENYYASIKPLRWMMPTLLFIGLTNIMGIQMLVPMNMERKVLVSVVVGAIVDMIFNAILIPNYAATGAAIGTMVAEIVVFIILYCSDIKLFFEIFREISPAKTLLASMCGSMLSMWVLHVEYSCFVSLLLSAFCFGTGFFLSLFLLKDSFFMEVVKRIRYKAKI